MTSLRAIKHNLTLVVGATMLAASRVLLTLLGLVAVVIPAALAIPWGWNWRGPGAGCAIQN